MSLAKRGFSAAVYSYIAQMATKVLNFLSAFFVISLLTVEEYGIYNLFLSLVLIFSSLGFGVPKMINRYYPEYEQKEDWYNEVGQYIHHKKRANYVDHEIHTTGERLTDPLPATANDIALEFRDRFLLGFDENEQEHSS